jgi:predicted permease
VTLAIVLLVGAGLLLRSFWRLQQTSPGFDPENVLTFRVSASWSERAEAVATRQLRTMQRVMALPGVTAVSLNSFPPAGVDYPTNEFSIAGRDTGERTFTVFRQVSADYFKTLRIPILRGDTCRDEVNLQAPRKAVVTRTFADRFFPNDNPIGHEIVLGATSRREIVGVVGDVRERGLLRDPEPVAYLCGLLSFWPDPFYLVRTDSKYTLSVSTLRAALREIEPQRSVYSIAPLTERMSETISEPRINMILLTLFAATALLLAAIGLYGMLAQFVSQRRREIGLRIALGAQPADVLAQVVRHGISVIGIGLIVGAVSAFLLARFMSTLVFGISPRDPLTFALVPIVLSLIATFATIIPARRAVRVDPMRALRDD